MQIPDVTISGGRLSRLSNLLVGVGLVVIALLWTYSALLIVSLKDKAWGDATSRSEHLLRSVERTLDRNIELYDLFLKTVVERMQNPVLESASPEIRQLSLFDGAANARGYGSIFVLDEQGAAFADSGSLIPRKVNGFDRPYFQVHRARDAGLFIGRPWNTRVSGRYMIPLSRRFGYADGSFAGVVIGAIEIAYFEDIFKKLNQDQSFVIEMIFDDADVVSSLETGAGPSERDADRVRSLPKGSFVSADLPHTFARLNTFMKVGTTSMHVNVALPVKGIDAAWWPQACSIMFVVGVLTAGVVLLLFALRRELVRRASAEAELSRLVLTDALTGIPNRRSFDENFDVSKKIFLDKPIALLLFDTDYFKAYNDRYGHPAGDQVLKSVGSIINAKAAGRNGLAFRIGGEEFAMLLTDVDEAEAMIAAQDARRAVEAEAIRHEGGVGGVVTVSVGVAHTARHPRVSAGQCLSLADEALYRAKHTGRNRVQAAAAATGAIEGEPRSVAFA